MALSSWLEDSTPATVNTTQRATTCLSNRSKVVPLSECALRIHDETWREGNDYLEAMIRSERSRSLYEYLSFGSERDEDEGFLRAVERFMTFGMVIPEQELVEPDSTHRMRDVYSDAPLERYLTLNCSDDPQPWLAKLCMAESQITVGDAASKSIRKRAAQALTAATRERRRNSRCDEREERHSQSWVALQERAQANYDQAQCFFQLLLER